MHHAVICDPSKLEAGEWYKYVKVGETFRFLASNELMLGHGEMVSDGEVATAAGLVTVSFDGKNWAPRDPGSVTLGITDGGIDDLRKVMAASGLEEKSPSKWF